MVYEGIKSFGTVIICPFLSLSRSEICKRIGIEILTQRRISGLLSELDLLGLITGNVISKGRYGRTKRIHGLISFQTVKEIFIEDPVLFSLL